MIFNLAARGTPPMSAADWREARLSGDGGRENKHGGGSWSDGGATPRRAGRVQAGARVPPAKASARRGGQGTPGPRRSVRVVLSRG